MEKNKRNKIIGLSIGILIVLIVVVSSTYAYWQITKTQETPNDIVAACLDLNLEDKSEAIDLDSAWPISDDEASSLTGYTFTVTNNCDEEINYIVGLNRVEESNYLQDTSIKVRLDDKSSQVYGELSNVEYADSENTYTSRVSKQVSVETISANGTNEHTMRVWVSEDAPVTEQSKIFQGQVFITGGQGIEVPECYTIANNGTILGYDLSCGTEVKVPAEINGIKVKTITQSSFAPNAFQMHVLYNEDTEEGKYIFYYDDTSNELAVINFMKQNFCDDPETCTLDDLESMNVSVITSVEEFDLVNWEDYSGYEVVAANIDPENGELISVNAPIKILDLSATIYLEDIMSEAFDYNKTLEKIIFPENGNIIIGSSAFGNTYKLIEVTITNAIKNIGDWAFNGGGSFDTPINDSCHWSNKDQSYNCEYGNITKLTIPENASLTIGEYAFEHNQISGKLIFSDNTSIGHGAFVGNQISEVVINSQNVETNAFADNQIDNAIIGTKVVKNILRGNPLTNLTLLSTVQAVEDSAFFEGNQIQNLVIEDTEKNPSQLTTIGNRSFIYNQLTKVVLPASVTSIGEQAFSSNGTLTEIIIKRENGEGLTLGNNFNVNLDDTIANVTYNPNYSE